METFNDIHKHATEFINHLEKKYGKHDVSALQAQEKVMMKQFIEGNKKEAILENINEILGNAQKGLLCAELPYTGYLLHVTLDMIQDGLHNHNKRTPKNNQKLIDRIQYLEAHVVTLETTVKMQEELLK